MKRGPRAIDLRAVTDGVVSQQPLRFYVIEESEAGVAIDNAAPNPMFRCRVTLCKLPNGRLANSAGQEFIATDVKRTQG